MSTPLLPTPADLTLPQIMARFSTEETAIKYFEAIRWANGVVCPHCQNADESRIWIIKPNAEKKIRFGLRQCAECKKQFRVTVGTIFEDSHIPLNLWLIAWYLLSGAKKGMSAKQLQRHLGLGSYKSAWFLSHRIRHAMQDPVFENKLSGDVEVDETYCGGKERRNYDLSKGEIKTGWNNKTPVVSLVQRDGTKRSMVMEKVTALNLQAAIMEHVAAGSRVHTDDSRLYLKVSPTHEHHAVNHSAKQYAIKKDGFTAHTNTVESSFSLLKRGIVGSFHHISKKHLGKYLSEFDFRWNNRGISDGERTVVGLKKATGKRLRFKNLVK